MGPAFGLREMSQLLLFIVIVLLSYLIKFSCDGGTNRATEGVLHRRYARARISCNEYVQTTQESSAKRRAAPTCVSCRSSHPRSKACWCCTACAQDLSKSVPR
jgi:hypothetical protein